MGTLVLIGCGGGAKTTKTTKPDSGPQIISIEDTGYLLDARLTTASYCSHVAHHQKIPQSEYRAVGHALATELAVYRKKAT